MKKMRKMNTEAPDEIGVGTFVCMKEDVLPSQHEEMDDEDVAERNEK